ncbi:hypothetical protein BU25DRAFT_266330 [Macroventuria anomochaeta]|uniref:Uncharacterized protein n=1 Tax=Macroventuria anomochaeta TaxID=301207 RepID=A0ACB6S7B0_9PLEO|nr:uncharacterized protein BU25DRAFT_266330 [Macroventuria anomochaeta]KAF2630150.1 hypothetical protein BU25DRAFT_266330 [Macroventuria anomochaeta]
MEETSDICPDSIRITSPAIAKKHAHRDMAQSTLVIFNHTGAAQRAHVSILANARSKACRYSLPLSVVGRPIVPAARNTLTQLRQQPTSGSYKYHRALTVHCILCSACSRSQPYQVTYTHHPAVACRRTPFSRRVRRPRDVGFFSACATNAS